MHTNIGAIKKIDILKLGIVGILLFKYKSGLGLPRGLETGARAPSELKKLFWGLLQSFGWLLGYFWRTP